MLIYTYVIKIIFDRTRIPDSFCTVNENGVQFKLISYCIKIPRLHLQRKNNWFFINHKSQTDEDTTLLKQNNTNTRILPFVFFVIYLSFIN